MPDALLIEAQEGGWRKPPAAAIGVMARLAA